MIYKRSISTSSTRCYCWFSSSTCKKMGKTPLQINIVQIMADNSNEPTPDLEVVSDTSQRTEFSDCSDLQLNEKIKRLESHIESLVSKLPDGGAKLQMKLKRLKDERERRKLQRPKEDAAECAEVQFRSPTNSDAMHLDKHLASQPQSSFAARFSDQLERSDNDTCNAFGEELRTLQRSDPKSCRKGRLSLSNQKRQTTISERQMPFRSVTACLVDKDNDETSSGNCKVIASSSHSRSSPDRSFHATSPEKTSPIRRTRNSMKRKIDAVVVLDEEDAQPIQTIEREDKIEAWSKDAKIYYPERCDPEAVELCGSDLDCLNPGCHLSSPIMNFYIQYLRRAESSKSNTRDDYHFFNTYFYKKLEEAVLYKRNDKVAYYEKFRRWWKGVAIFQKTYIFLPIHADEHWSLVIICIPGKEVDCGPLILHLDSLRYHNSTPIFEKVESFLREEWNYLKQIEQPLDVSIGDRVWKNLSRRIHREILPVPQQKNDSDCGLFVLYFMERFIMEAPERLTKEDLVMFGRNWFNPEDASRLRERIRRLISEQFELASIQNSDARSPSSVANGVKQCRVF